MKKLLLVEDDNDIRHIYIQTFKASGYDVDFAVDGAEALDKVKEQQFDLILLDVILPKINGIDVLKQCRVDSSTAKSTPIFLLTNMGQQDILNQAKRLGVNGYFIKAMYRPSDLVEKVDEYFQKESLHV